MIEQKCWKTRTIGVSLGKQQREYAKAFMPWPSSDRMRLELQDRLKSLKENLKKIHSAQTIIELQEWLLIGNVNDFMMRDDPTLEEITLIAADFKKWGLMTINHMTSGKKGRECYLIALEKCVKAALKKFAKLN